MNPLRRTSLAGGRDREKGRVGTLAESGLPGFEVVGFFGVMAPAGTPREIVTRLNGEFGKVLVRPDIRERFASQPLEVCGPRLLRAAVNDPGMQFQNVPRW
jgi:tripartite-type tricarboxylate transporter receptor subunit TctC